MLLPRSTLKMSCSRLSLLVGDFMIQVAFLSFIDFYLEGNHWMMELYRVLFLIRLGCSVKVPFIVL